MPTPEELNVPSSPNGETTPEPAVRRRRRAFDEPPQGDGSQGMTDDSAETIRELFKGLRTAMDSPNFAKIVEVLAKKLDHDTPIREKELQFRREVHERNTRFYATNRNYFLIGLFVCLAFLGWIMWLFQTKPDTLLPVLTAVIGLIAGAGGGYIFGQHRRDDSAT